MKKLTKLTLSAIAIILISTYGFYFAKNQKKVNAERFITIEEELLKKIDHEIAVPKQSQKLIKTKKNQQEILAYAPLDSEKKVIEALAEQQMTIAKEILETETGTLKIVLSSEQHVIQKNINTYQHYYQLYRWNRQRKNWQREKKQKATATLINQLNQKPLSLGDMFSNQQNLLIVTRKIQEDLLAQAKNPQTDITAILDLPALLAAETNFVYEADQLKIPYSGEAPYVDSYTIDYQKLGAYLNPDFVDKKYLTLAPSDEEKTASKMIALTFDDGPNNTTTPQILKILERKKVPATFFMLGAQAEKYPNIVKDIHEQGHVLANHSFNHPDLTTLTAAETARQIKRTQIAIYQATGVLPEYVRPPYGSFDYPTALTIGLPIVNWSVDSFDWKTKNVKKIKKEVATQIKPESIILMHDIYQETVDSLEDIITQLEKEGYHFVTVTELLDATTKPLTAYYHRQDQRPIIER